MSGGFLRFFAVTFVVSTNDVMIRATADSMAALEQSRRTASFLVRLVARSTERDP